MAQYLKKNCDGEKRIQAAMEYLEKMGITITSGYTDSPVYISIGDKTFSMRNTDMGPDGEEYGTFPPKMETDGMRFELKDF